MRLNFKLRCDACFYIKWLFRTVAYDTSTSKHVIIPLYVKLPVRLHVNAVWHCGKEQQSLSTAWRRMGSICMAPFIFNFGVRWSRVVGFKIRPLYPRKRATGTNLSRWLGESLWKVSYEIDSKVSGWFSSFEIKYVWHLMVVLPTAALIRGKL